MPTPKSAHHLPWLAATLLHPTAALAAEYILSPDTDPIQTTGDFTSVQEALDEAQDGDVITLQPGTYKVNLMFPRKAITLRGDPGASQDEVILDGSGCDPDDEGYQWCSVMVFKWKDGGGELPGEATAAVENLTITGGRGSDYRVSSGQVEASTDTFGGGLWLQSANPNLSRITVSDSSASSHGGGMYLYTSSPALNELTLSRNSAPNGGGMYLSVSSPTLSMVTLDTNTADSGGGMFINASSPTLSHVTLEGNSATGDGGGMYLSISSPTLDTVTFAQNSAGLGRGGGVHMFDSAPTLTDVHLSDNQAGEGGGLYLSESVPTLNRITVQANTAGYGGGMYLYASSPIMHDVNLLENVANMDGGGMFLTESSPALNNSILSGNVAANEGGGIFLYLSSPILLGGVFEDNSATSHGGGMHLFSSTPTLSHVTLMSNSSLESGGGLYITASSSPTLHNTILTSNTAPEGSNLYRFETSPSPTLDHVLAWTGTPGDPGFFDVTPSATTLIADPLFIDAPGDLRLLAPESPAINVGSELCYNPGSKQFDATCTAPEGQDPDGSLPDLGAFGGAGADDFDRDGDGSSMAWWPEDAEGDPAVEDGYSITSDCDDSDSAIYPGAPETCEDGIDSDCSGADLSCDDVDNDGDGFTNEQRDCNDANSSIYPGAPETCGDGIDSDCSGADLSCDDVDNDADGLTENQGDCSDSNAGIYPGAPETCEDGIDSDCSGADLSCEDVDNDEDYFTESQGDCDDNNPAVYPGASESCGDGVDSDCSGADVSCDDLDNDEDGFTESQGDCHDEDPDINPTADETPYNGIDEDCSGGDLTDQDGDGSDGGELGPDCDDSDPNVYPGAEELADGLDNNCDGHIPELEVPQCPGTWVGGRCVGEGCGGCGDGEAAALLPLMIVWRRRRSRGGSRAGSRAAWYSIMALLLSLGMLRLNAGEGAPAQRGVSTVEIGGASSWPQPQVLIVANSDYGPGWPSLPGVKNDTRTYVDVFEALGYGVQVEKDLKRKEISEVLDTFVQTWSEDPERRLVIVYLGHGHTARPGEGRPQMGYLVPVDAPAPRPGAQPGDVDEMFARGAVPIVEFKQLAQGAINKQMLFLFDSCFAGTIFSADVRASDGPPALPELSLPVRYVITAGDAGQTVPDRSHLPELLRAGLLDKEADSNKDRYITGYELGLYLESHVAQGGGSAQRPQKGKIGDASVQSGEFLLLDYAQDVCDGAAQGPLMKQRCLNELRQAQAALVARPAAPKDQDRWLLWRDHVIRLESVALPDPTLDALLVAARAARDEAHRAWLGLEVVDVGPGAVASAAEITVGQYQACVEMERCKEPVSVFGTPGCHLSGRAGEDPALPINCLTYDQARDFARWVGGRLPTEQEWRALAASAPLLCPDARIGALPGLVVQGGCGEGGPRASCRGREGSCDVYGNVWEWLTPAPDAPGDAALVAGGDWRSPPEEIRTSPVRQVGVDQAAPGIGLRVVWGAP